MCQLFTLGETTIFFHKHRALSKYPNNSYLTESISQNFPQVWLYNRIYTIHCIPFCRPPFMPYVVLAPIHRKNNLKVIILKKGHIANTIKNNIQECLTPFENVEYTELFREQTIKIKLYKIIFKIKHKDEPKKLGIFDIHICATVIAKSSSFWQTIPLVLLAFVWKHIFSPFREWQ